MARERLADKALTIATGSGVESVTQVALNLFLVRLFDSQEAFGSYRQVWLVINTLTPLFLFGLSHGIYYFLPGLPDDRHRAFMARTTLFLTGSGLVFSICLFAGAGAVADLFSNPELAPLFRAAALFPLFAVPNLLLFPFLVSRNLHARGAAVNALFVISQTLLIVALAATGSDLSTIFRSVVLLVGVRYVYSLYEVGRIAKGPLRGVATVGWRENLSYSIPVGLSTIMIVLGQRLDKLFVSGFMSTVDYAVYSVGAIEFPGIVLIEASSNTVMRPYISALHHQGNKSEIHGFWLRSLRKQALVIVPMAMFLAVFARPLVEILFTPEYGGAVLIFQIYLAVPLLRIAPPGLILTSVGRSRIIFYGTIAFVVVNMGLNLLLIGPMGMAGPPVATLIATAGLMLYYALCASRYLEIPLARMVPIRTLLPIFLVAAAAMGASSSVILLGWGRIATLLAGLPAAGIVYVAAGSAARVLKREDLEIVRRWITLRWLRRGE